METEGLKTLNDDGSLPSTRMGDALEARSRVDSLIRADDDSRAQKRALVKGLVDGNSPYRNSDLVAAGRSDMCNVNWRIAEAYLATALSAVYDVFSQTATYTNVETYWGKGMEQQDASAGLTEEFDRLQRTDRYWDYEVQNSQYDMVLYGCGPLLFRSPLDWRARYNPCGMLLVPEYAKSKTEEWEEVAYRIYYTPHDLYNYIRYPESASKLGWNVDVIKRSIMSAHPRTREGGQYQNWEWHQQRLKNSSYQYSAECRSIHVAHYLFREFPREEEELGRISHTMVDLSMDGQGSGDFLYRNNRRHSSWDEVIHPMYYDHGGGGYHHSVTGMGIKMFAAMSYQNRLICNLADKSFAPKLLFKPTSAAADQQLQLAKFGDYARIPNGFELQQVSMQGMLDEGMTFNQSLTQLIGSNLSQYRQENAAKTGNPDTAAEVNYKASQEATMNQTQLNHYYHQLDWLYTEQFRRATNLNIPQNTPGGKAAHEFQERCLARGIKKEALRMVHVTASRITGNGSAYLRKQTLQRLLALLPRLPQDGQDKLIRDYVASETSFALVNRYAPEREKGKLPSDHEMLATLQVAACKDHVAPVVTESQNHTIFAGVFLHAAAEVLASVKKSGPQSIPQALSFLETIGPAIQQHLSKIKDDPTRAAIFKELSKQFAKMAKVTDELKKMAQKMAKKQQEQQQMMQQANRIQNGQDPEIQLKSAMAKADMKLKNMKAANDISNKNKKAEQTLNIKAAQTRQNMAKVDLQTAQDIRRKRSAFSE